MCHWLTLHICKCHHQVKGAGLLLACCRNQPNNCTSGRERICWKGDEPLPWDKFVSIVASLWFWKTFQRHCSKVSKLLALDICLLQIYRDIHSIILWVSLHQRHMWDVQCSSTCLDAHGHKGIIDFEICGYLSAMLLASWSAWLYRRPKFAQSSPQGSHSDVMYFKTSG